MAQLRVGAVLLVADPMLFGQSQRIIELAGRYRQPTVYELRMFAERGGLLSYGPFEHERFEQMAVYVDRILRGAKASRQNNMTHSLDYAVMWPCRIGPRYSRSKPSTVRYRH